MAKFFIDRPVFAWVIALFILLAGAAAQHAAAPLVIATAGGIGAVR